MPNGKNENLGGAGGRGGRGGYDSGRTAPTTRERNGEASGGRRDTKFSYFGGRASVIAGASPDDEENEQTTSGRNRTLYEFDTEILRPGAARVNESDNESRRNRDQVDRTRDYVGRNRDQDSIPDGRPGREQQDEVSRRTPRREDEEGMYDFGGRQSVAVGASPWAAAVRGKGGRVDFGERTQGPSRPYGDGNRSGRTRGDMRQGVNDGGSQRKSQRKEDDKVYDFGGRQSVAVGASPFGAGIKRKSEMLEETGPSSRRRSSVGGAEKWSPDERRSDGAKTFPVRDRSTIGTVTGSRRFERGQQGSNEEYARHASRRNDTHGLYDFARSQSMAMREGRGGTGGRDRDERQIQTHDGRVRENLGTHTTEDGRNLPKREVSYQYYDLGGQYQPTRQRSQWGLNINRAQGKRVETARSPPQNVNVERKGERGEKNPKPVTKNENVGATGQRGSEQGGQGSGKEGQPARPHRRMESNIYDTGGREAAGIGRAESTSSQHRREPQSGKSHKATPSTDGNENRNSEGSGCVTPSDNPIQT